MFVCGGKESNEGTRKDGQRRGPEGKKVMRKQRRRETEVRKGETCKQEEEEEKYPEGREGIYK